MLTQFEAEGGLKPDLEAIVTHGKNAEALNQSQGSFTRQKGAAADRSQVAFVALQKENAAVMRVAKSLRAELTNAGDTANLKKLNAIIALEAQTAFSVEADEAGGTKKKKTRVQSQEAIRAEIARDAKSFLEFTEISANLAARKVDAARLQKLKADAEALTGKVEDKVAGASDRKIITAKEQEAVSKQSLHWSSAYPLLAQVAKRDVRAADALRPTKK
ncbi:MAG: hypothetical protein DI536_05135 [Archangium gephyra]|uniref:Uncharacterized protein n=1 Tax=Archangium gephyra TaxID=48 RepID=A0A2W5TQ71_9BACT|nr:MAG: hypothetical protein DI536_05135 [Archangium gephyra]